VRPSYSWWEGIASDRFFRGRVRYRPLSPGNVYAAATVRPQHSTWKVRRGPSPRSRNTGGPSPHQYSPGMLRRSEDDYELRPPQVRAAGSSVAAGHRRLHTNLRYSPFCKRAHPPLNGTRLYIGAESGGTSPAEGWFYGSIDEVALMGSALSAADIGELQTRPLSPFEDPCRRPAEGVGCAVRAQIRGGLGDARPCGLRRQRQRRRAGGRRADDPEARGRRRRAAGLSGRVSRIDARDDKRFRNRRCGPENHRIPLIRSRDRLWRVD
jgi:hypothetical protein